MGRCRYRERTLFSVRYFARLTLASLFIISLVIVLFSFTLIPYPDPCARITRSSDIFFIIRFAMSIRLMTIPSSRKRKKRFGIVPSTTSLFRTLYDAIKSGKGRVRAFFVHLKFYVCIYVIHTHIYSQREKCSDNILEFFHITGAWKRLTFFNWVLSIKLLKSLK